MKKIIKTTVVFLLVVIVINGMGVNIAYAATGYGCTSNDCRIDETSVVCSSNVKKGEPIVCTFTADSDGNKRAFGLENEFLKIEDIVSTKIGLSIDKDKIPYQGEFERNGGKSYTVTIDTTDVPSGSCRLWLIFGSYLPGISTYASKWYYYTDITITGDGSTPSTPASPAPADPTLTAAPTSSTVLVNGAPVAFDAYNINGNNYFKLRDLAYSLNGTEKQFEVSWDGVNNAITLTSGMPYTVVGGEMTGKGAGSKTPTANGNKIYLDGQVVSLTAYNIDGNNYFKLRDIGQTFNFGVAWDGAQNTIRIDASSSYTSEYPVLRREAVKYGETVKV